MYLLKPAPEPIAPKQLDLLQQAEPATIGHFLHTGFMDHTIRALFSKARVAGTAITVRSPGPDGALVHHAVGNARPGDVLVIDRCGDTGHASLGGAVAYAARAAGVAGIIVDGVVTDIDELREYGVPVWAKGLTTITVKTLGLGGEFCIPVSCGGVAVSPGDAILADENGVLVLRPELIDYAANKALGLQKAEIGTLKRIDAGEKYPDIMGTSDVIQQNLEQQQMD